MDVERVLTIAHACTRMFAKPGKENSLEVRVNAPVLNEAETREQHRQLVDVHFCVIAVDLLELEKHRGEFVDELHAYPDAEVMEQGISYLALGMVVGSQDSALRVLAVGKALGLWDLVVPASLGFDGAGADQLAERGMVFSTGFRG